MPVCFVPNCDSGYLKSIRRNKASGTKNPSLFSPPNDPELLAKWIRQIPRKDKVLTVNDKVCSLHFSESDIIKYDEIKLKDGSIYKSERKKYELVKGAYPSIFPNCPAYLSSVKQNRKSPKKRKLDPGNVAVNVKRLRLMSNEENNSNFDNEIPTSTFNFDALLQAAREYVLPQRWTFSCLDQKGIMFLKWSDDNLTDIQKRINITPELKIRTFLYSKEVFLKSFTHVQNLDTFHNLISTMNDITICESLTKSHKNTVGDNGTGFRCVGFVSPFISDVKCTLCKKRDRLSKLKSKLSSQDFQNVKRRNTRLVKKVNKLTQRLQRVQVEMSKISEESLRSQISQLPENEQEAIMACLQASKVKDKRGRRYTQKWLYQCMLLRIKNFSQYEYMRRNEILALPCRNTISRSMKNLKPHYGFDTTVFQLLGEKSKHMPLPDRRGVILLDEMKLTPYACLDKKNLEVHGFTSLGKYTPEIQENVLGDHGLVFIFQPFRGKWVQPIGAFLSKNAAPGHVLAELILECVVLLENAGLYVDAIVSDGAQWNRSMWKQFSSSTQQPWCVHPCDPEGANGRHLHFISDFPHLIKNLRNWVVDKKTFTTPDGEIQWKFWLNLLKIQNEMYGEFGLRDCFTLNKHHINPEHYEKMNVCLAYQFFGFDVACAMELHKNNILLSGCDSTIKFIHRIHSLIKAMTSACQKGALWKNSNEEKTIKEFLTYLDDWRNVTSVTAALAPVNPFLTNNTFVGLKATLHGTLKLFEYLSYHHGFLYLMTARLNQNNLEKFFGIIRSHCGTHDHPNSLLFIQLYRLLSVYSLVKPPKGTNVGDTEIISTLLGEDVPKTNFENDRKNNFDFLLQRILEKDDVPENKANENQALIRFAGYIAFKFVKRTDCMDCKASLLATDQEEIKQMKLILLQDKYDALHYPSKKLIHFVGVVEKHILKVACPDSLNKDLIFDIADSIYKNENLTLLGCSTSTHSFSFSKLILSFLLTVRMYFILKVVNKNCVENAKTKKKRKQSKL